MIDNRYTVWQVNKNTQEKIKELFTGNYEECCNAISFLLNKKKWSVYSIGLINHETERFVSWSVDNTVSQQ